MTLSIVIPAFNEERRLGSALERLLTDAALLDLLELIVVDDGSTDRTAEVAREFAEAHPELPLRLLQLEQNRGKGAALRAGLLAAEAPLIGFIDADLSVPPPAFLDARALIEGGADMVVGRRVDDDGSSLRLGQPMLRRLLGHMFVATRQRIIGLPFADTQCPFKLLTREVAQAVVPSCTVDTWTFDVELLVVASRQGWQIDEMPVAWKHVEGSKLQAGPSVIVSTLRELLAIRRLHGPEGT
jgi:dolichyl-phosphate beta-glucosyltransferase